MKITNIMRIVWLSLIVFALTLMGVQKIWAGDIKVKDVTETEGSGNSKLEECMQECVEDFKECIEDAEDKAEWRTTSYYNSVVLGVANTGKSLDDLSLKIAADMSKCTTAYSTCLRGCQGKE